MQQCQQEKVGRCQQRWGAAGEGGRQTWAAWRLEGGKGEQPGQRLVLPEWGYWQVGSFQGAGQGWGLAGEDSVGVKHGEMRSTRLRNVVSYRCVLRRQTAVSE